ncbi:hypothetical protein BU16DRAFT_531546 [Lophium mytilinum]|uniref:Uncharacterized protein n=1 Tax=Lophium mytilinum TaxID=390894 RepID=A0A6A6QBY0_9PEZI|nr:hypothetical protein BU16DRAFT_531546 [Lophium mytilinum]
MAYIKLGLVALGAYALGKKKARDTSPPPPARYEEPARQADYGYGPPRYQESSRYPESARYQEEPQQLRYPADAKQ